MNEPFLTKKRAFTYGIFQKCSDIVGNIANYPPEYRIFWEIFLDRYGNSETCDALILAYCFAYGNTFHNTSWKSCGNIEEIIFSEAEKQKIKTGGDVILLSNSVKFKTRQGFREFNVLKNRLVFITDLTCDLPDL